MSFEVSLNRRVTETYTAQFQATSMRNARLMAKADLATHVGKNWTRTGTAAPVQELTMKSVKLRTP